MKKEDIDKRIGMPDVVTEWARFEREVIAKDTKPRLLRMVVWTGGIGIAAAIALLFVLNNGKGEMEKQPLVAQQPQPVHVESTTADTISEEENHPTVGSTANSQEALQRRIAGLTIVPNSSYLGTNAMRLAGSDSTHRNDSVIVILNGVIQPDSISRELIIRPYSYNANVYFYKQHLMIESMMVYKGEDARKRFEATYGFPPPRLGFIEMTTIPDTLCEAYMQQHPEKIANRLRIEGFVQSEDSLPLADAWVSCGAMGAATDSTGHFVMWTPRTVTKIDIRHVGYFTIRSNIQPTDTALIFRMKDATKIREVKVIPKKDRSKPQRIRLQ